MIPRCLDCEHFDAGGEAAVTRADTADAPIHGDCLNRLSGRFQTWSNESCGQFLPDSVQFAAANAAEMARRAS